MKNFFTGAFLVFTGATLAVLLGGFLIATIMTVAPMVPVWLRGLMLIAAMITLVLSPALPEIGRNFYDWKKNK